MQTRERNPKCIMCLLLNGFLLIRVGRARIGADQIYDIGTLKATTSTRRKFFIIIIVIITKRKTHIDAARLRLD
jgi:hypothetical protein